MGVGLERAIGSRDDDAALDPQYVDRRPVKVREDVVPDHLFHRSRGRPCRGPDRAPGPSPPSSGLRSCAVNRTVTPCSCRMVVTSGHDLLLKMRIEADQRFVEQQKFAARRAAPAPAAGVAIRRRRGRRERRAARAAAPTVSSAAVHLLRARRGRGAEAPSANRRRRWRRNPSRAAAGRRRQHAAAADSRRCDCRARAASRTPGSPPRPAARARGSRATAWSCRPRWDQRRR